jgi:type II secretory pathway pseudopilin PulG
MKKSFTLIEVLVFISIVALFFVTAAAVSVATLRNMIINEHKIVATRYAEELSEWLRSEKEADWNLFYTNVSACGLTARCFTSVAGSEDQAWTNSCNPNCTLIDNLYSRTVDFTAVVGPPPQVNVTVKVSWQELGNTYTVPIKTGFSLFE